MWLGFLSAILSQSSSLPLSVLLSVLDRLSEYKYHVWQRSVILFYELSPCQKVLLSVNFLLPVCQMRGLSLNSFSNKLLKFENVQVSKCSIHCNEPPLHNGTPAVCIMRLAYHPYFPVGRQFGSYNQLTPVPMELVVGYRPFWSGGTVGTRDRCILGLVSLRPPGLSSTP